MLGSYREDYLGSQNDPQRHDLEPRLEDPNHVAGRVGGLVSRLVSARHTHFIVLRRLSRAASPLSASSSVSEDTGAVQEPLLKDLSYPRPSPTNELLLLPRKYAFRRKFLKSVIMPPLRVSLRTIAQPQLNSMVIFHGICLDVILTPLFLDVIYPVNGQSNRSIALWDRENIFTRLCFDCNCLYKWKCAARCSVCQLCRIEFADAHRLVDVFSALSWLSSAWEKT